MTEPAWIPPWLPLCILSSCCLKPLIPLPHLLTPCFSLKSFFRFLQFGTELGIANGATATICFKLATGCGLDDVFGEDFHVSVWPCAVSFAKMLMYKCGG